MATSDALGSMYGGITSKFTEFNWMWFAGIVVLGVILYLGITMIRNKKIFIYKIRIFQTRENGSVKEINCKGGYLKNKNTGITKFRIKKGRMPWDWVDLTTTPQASAIDYENRIYYKQIDLKTYIQLKRVFDKSILMFQPVEQDVVYGAMLEMKRVDEALHKDSNWAKVAPFITMGVIFVLAIVGWYFVMDAKCPAVK
jgi:uncharacterized membrane protein YcjF (UPF0283 family)